ncbi:MAG: hypothetical protein PHY41_05165 [Candidatus Cloacimonetes bacterium]|jgi:hypothetical protein|nr:hypothetical protein [Candidatus Cloacimonadota bacterium]MDY0298399.1 hypothetical protein [Candidatus Cloacimonadaceae bacterium]MCB5278194.1 hypothetical protein [Candidatus Cloacimonadota bacterium]MCK9331759.1 hypothetical protein [Candidatus Cloacimonadota bacterium]MDD3282845.1 hypothetical protein [Candidatus Cloacimonadota bacterium]
MNNPYSGILNSLSNVSDRLIQVTAYKDLLSNYNAVIILDEDPDGWLEKLSPLAKYIHKHKLNLPLIINRRFIKYSLDSYPLEFINIISCQRENILVKEDLLANLQIKPADVRLQMEREFKSKWLLTRQVILEGKMNSRNLRHTLQLSITALIPCVKGFFFLSKQPYPQSSDELFAQAALICKIDLNAFAIWMKKTEIELADIERYLSILNKLMELMETYPVE